MARQAVGGAREGYPSAKTEWTETGASVVAVGTGIDGMPTTNVNERMNLAALTKSDG